MERHDEPTLSHPVFESLADDRRRRLLRILQGRTDSVGLSELATHLVAEEADKPLFRVGELEVESTSIGLVHRQLPRLDEAGLVAWDQEREIVRTTDHPALSDPKFQQLLRETDGQVDAVCGALADDRRRVVLGSLADADAPVSRVDLAEQVLARERNAGRAAASANEIRTELHHVHLPKLRAAGLVEYEPDGDGVTYCGHPALPEEWLDSRLEESPRAILPDARSSDDVWSITGRDDVIARGQSLFEQADDELFLMFTTEGLLEDGCVRRLREAVDRGVDVYVGSQTPSVRDLVRERVPEATIWEPQMDWLNLPPEYEKVGRLVFADREAIMLATLGEETGDGVYSETAITGTGENNPLVVLMREMLGSRLDHLDAQSEGFLREIPL